MARGVLNVNANGLALFVDINDQSVDDFPYVSPGSCIQIPADVESRCQDNRESSLVLLSSVVANNETSVREGVVHRFAVFQRHHTKDTIPKARARWDG